MGIVRTAAGGAKKWTWWGRIVAAAEVALVAKRHLDLLGPGEVGELRNLLVKSKGRPDNLTSPGAQADPGAGQEAASPGLFARNATATFVPFAKRKKS